MGVMGCGAFIGGVFHANFAPGGPIDKFGAMAAIPAVVVSLATVALALQGTEKAGRISSSLGISRLSPFGLLAATVAAAVGGAIFGATLARMNAKSAP